ncbi:MAG: F0F1 ATP synthase subunit A [Pseudomonadota bacterium]
MADPIAQFQIKKIATLGTIGGHEIAFTNSALYMLIAVAGVSLLMIGATSRRAVVPGRMQSIAELTYEFVADMLRSSAGKEGMKFFPLVFTLFTFVLFANMLGMIPGTFTVTSHIVITAALAVIVFLTVLLYGFYKNGAKFLKLFVPSGIPVYIMPLIVLIEVISFLSRPLSHSVRLFANVFAGHITLKVFASFVPMLAGLGILGWLGAVLPLGMTVALTALEFLVAFLQAYVFTILTCIYLNDALHPGH